LERPTNLSRQSQTAVFLATIVLLPFVLDATSLFRWPAFVKAETVAIEIVIRDAIDPFDNERKRLFADEPDRKATFQTQLESDLSRTLADSGLAVDPDANAGILVGIYGHSVPAADCGIDWVLYFDLVFWEGVDDDLEPQNDISRSGIEAVSDQELETYLLTAVLNAVESELSYRKRALAHFREKVSE